LSSDDPLVPGARTGRHCFGVGVATLVLLGAVFSAAPDAEMPETVGIERIVRLDFIHRLVSQKIEE
jgi:hypothetical protein